MPPSRSAGYKYRRTTPLIIVILLRYLRRQASSFSAMALSLMPSRFPLSRPFHAQLTKKKRLRKGTDAMLSWFRCSQSGNDNKCLNRYFNFLEAASYAWTSFTVETWRVPRFVRYRLVKTWRTRVVNACGPKSLRENWENKSSAAENNRVKLHKISAEG